MLAYVFWHRRRPEVEAAEYEQALLAFHHQMRDAAPEGMRATATFHIQGAAWIGNEGHEYEDWYLIENSAALERINEAAVTLPMGKAHDAVARMAGEGVAGLYRPLGSEPAGLDAPSTLWFSKPRGISYGALHSRLEAIETGAKDRLWQRMMTLGPTPEFGLLGRGVDALPHAWEGLMVVRRPLG